MQKKNKLQLERLEAPFGVYGILFSHIFTAVEATVWNLNLKKKKVFVLFCMCVYADPVGQV